MRNYARYAPEVIAFSIGAWCIVLGGNEYILGAEIPLFLRGAMIMIAALILKQERKIDELKSLVEQLTCDESDDAENP